MKKLWNNIDFEKHSFLAKFLIPAASIIALVKVVVGFMDGEWLQTGIMLFATTYLILGYLMTVMIKTSKKFLIFLYVYTILFTLVAAYHLWTHNWVAGILEGIVICMFLSEMQDRYNNNGMRIEEEK